MNSITRLLICASLLLSLSACVDRNQADQNLVKGCVAGVTSLMPSDFKISSVKESTFGDSEEGPGLRAVKIRAAVVYGWINEDKTYNCIFEESFGFLNASHTAAIHQVDIDGKKYGKVGNELVGNVDDFVKLTDAIRKAMYEKN